MIKNYFKIAFRNLWNNKLFSLIKISSLAIGLSVSFVIGLMVYYDFSFDKFHPDKDHIYRITTEFVTPEGSFYNPGVSYPLGAGLQENATGITAVSSFLTTYPLHIKNTATDKTFKNPDFVIYADKEFFNVFTYKWLAGSKDTALDNPNQLVLSEKRAKKYFPNTAYTDIIGANMVYNDTIPVKISGVVANFTERTDIVFEEFISLRTARQSDMTSVVLSSNWNNTNSASQLFIRTDKNTRAADVRLALHKLADVHKDPNEVEFGNERKFYMQPLQEMHFDANYYTFDFDEETASKSVLISLGCIALFLLLLGSINFINLNTAQATQRAKEIGIRKTLGGSKKQLIYQFLGETFLLTVCAAIVSVALSFWLLKIFEEYIPVGLTSELFAEPIVITSIILLLILVTFLSGFYPALVLSHFKPIAVLKNQIVAANDKTSVRKYLTVFQFVIAQVFIIATLLVGKQISFLLQKDMGFKTEAIASFRAPWYTMTPEKQQRLLAKVEAIPEVSTISLAESPPASFSTSATNVSYFGNDVPVHTELQLLYGDKNYLELYGIELLAGRKQNNDNIKEYVINETYLRLLGFTNPEDAIGKMIKSDGEEHQIVGVIKDFNQRSLKTAIKPLAFMGAGGANRSFKTFHISFANVNGENLPVTTKKLESAWNEVYTDEPFELVFMDSVIKRFYSQERKTAVLLNWATGLAIVISCLGLLGLVVYTTERRTKEIGIRKVLGASLLELNVLLSKEFLSLVAIAFVLAAPIAYFGLDYWLQDFANKTKLSWWVFAISGIAMLLIALLIMGVRTYISSTRNPVKSLRTE
ncbi:ABC transporter permease [Cellulophaga sp. 20_2_10]|uniref:FtsX-like permease family protein n=1 Tax=Cellulophaga sp. 20_2_10 TaxID=2942476 RepID=UPI00201B30DF|nr:FtsX-like permease family protein [Cellulophaga sp. 20_2_10]MCL5246381.1 ABC transporter permease [Cellulophaga sp. 20_2_10]